MEESGLNVSKNRKIDNNDRKIDEMTKAVNSLQEGRKVKMYKSDGSIS